MRHPALRHGIGLLALTTALVACGDLTSEEAQAALDEAALSSAAASLTGGSIDLSTHFTIGGAVESAAGEIRSFVQSQLPCAEVTLDGSTLTIHYGALPGNCTYQGQTYAGTHTIHVMATDASELVVEHTWTDFHDQTVGVTGSAMVTWSGADLTRHVSYDLTWTRTSDGHVGQGTGNSTQMALETGIFTGFEETGDRTWTTSAGTWALDIAMVQMRWIDPCPQAGTYTLTTPAGKRVTLSFMRTATHTIRATLASGARSYDINVTTL
jgi:hypothetical protein